MEESTGKYFGKADWNFLLTIEILRKSGLFDYGDIACLGLDINV